MKTILFACIGLLIFTKSFAHPEEGTRKRLPPYYITKKETDKSLKKSEALFVFTFKGQTGKKISETIVFSCDAKEERAVPDTEGIYRYKTKPGKHKFRFFYNSHYEEIYTDTVAIGKAMRIEMTVQFELAGIEVIADKPVIYLYPETSTAVTVQLKPKGEFNFTYPAYNNGWSCVADPDGTLSFGAKKYNYLFWEGNLQLTQDAIDYREGSIVSKENLLSFLEEKLETMGLSAKEQQDFITYWYPRMAVNQNNYIHFLFNESWNAYADLQVNPKPDNVFRIFMTWSKAEAKNDFKPKPQQIPSFKRSGFTVVEWGGTELETIHP